MKMETFFEKFDQFADALDAVAKMRELVLHLAVTGKLVSQDPNDETAEGDFETFVKTREKSSLKRTKIDGEATAEEPSIPDSWIAVSLGELVSIRTGFAFKSGDYTEQGTFILRVTNINPDGSFDTSNAVFLPEAKLDEKMRGFLLEEHELLVVMVGGSLGKIGQVSSEILPALLNQNMWRLKPYSDRLDYRFLRLVLHDLNENRLQITPSTHGHLAMGTYAAAKVPFPPLAEQKRIVAKVDELMALCDRLEAQQQERDTRRTALARASLARFADAPAPANLNFLFHKSYDISPVDLRKSILTLAVQGKLVPQDPNDEPAGKLLEFIANQRSKLLGSDSLRKTKPCRQSILNEAPHEIPASWVFTMLGEVTDIGTGSTPSRTEAAFWIDGTIPWITSGSTSRSHITAGDELVTPAAVKAHRLRVYPPGTLLVALYGQGKTRGQVATLEISAAINQACAAVCSLDGTPSMQGYLKLLLEKQYDEMRSLSAGGAQPNLNVQKIKELFVPLPPLAEQHRIVAKVDQLMALVDELETHLAASRATAKKLLEALVAELTAAGAPSRRGDA